ncbi:hybrid sensor histidine kinase/response regulator [Allochromatium palmeri]|uniref:Sensory/regulatory protein RpfC n=1 Tax=Allochromatium palmeri TaxID=231048 RepID=A0A6N8EEH0_9GAMM|nr:ATP-binding protein [Allochromatium palmeri]MTW21036.1 response regulator [Allochromatium palmeri]
MRPLALRTSQIIWLATASLAVVVGIALATRAATQQLQTQFAFESEQAVALNAVILERMLIEVSRDLRYLAQSRALADAIEDTSAPRLDSVSGDWRLFVSAKPQYDQIRWIDKHGWERIRVNQSPNGPVAVLDTELQNKADRYYFTDAMRLPAGDIYVSPLDLNIEHGVIEQPRKPMLRLAKRLFDRDGNSHGIVIVNYLALNLLEALVNLHRSDIWLLNRDGYWLRATNAADEWGFMFARPDLTLAQRYPAAWARIVQDRSGQFETADGLWSFDTLIPALVMAGDRGARLFAPGTPAWLDSTSSTADGREFWKVVRHVPLSEYSAELQAIWLRYGGLLLGLLAIVFGSARALQRSQLREIEAHEAMARLEAAEARAASEAKSAFLANMSHEVRTPMNAVLGFLDMLLDTPLAHEQRALVQKIKNSARALLDIINDILDFSKIDAGKVELESTPFQLERVLRECVELFDIAAAEKGLEMIIDAPATLAGRYCGDPLRLSQILNNLIGNAIKFTARGSVVIAVRAFGDEDTRRRLRFEVRDTGIGLSSEQAARLFQPFTQADVSTTRRFGGTGLGLSICKGLVELMGGTIGVESREGEGATFWFELPLAVADAGGSALPDAVLSKPVASSPLFDAIAVDLQAHAARIRGAELLLVEDNPTNQEIAQAILRKMGLRVSVANNGREALEWLAEHEAELILMDLQMPVMDGLEATAAIRATDWGRERPIIAMTAAAFPEDRQRVLDAGMNDYVSKPIDPQQLLITLLRWLPARPDTAAPTPPAAETESITTASSVAAPTTPEIRLAGFDLAATRRRLDCDDPLLTRILRGFMHDFADWPAEFAAARAENETSCLQRLAHTLKGAAGNVGAVEVAATAEALEHALTQGADANRIDDLHAQCLAALSAAIESLRDFLATETPASAIEP